MLFLKAFYPIFKLNVDLQRQYIHYIITKNEILDQLDKLQDTEIPETLIIQEVDILSQGMNDEDKKKINLIMKSLQEKELRQVYC